MNIKYKELNEYYHNYKKAKVAYNVFRARVLRYWYKKEDAIKKKLLFTRRTKLKKTQDWRVCSMCWQFKSWSEFSVDRSNKSNNYRTPNCKECRNKLKREYRKNWWKEKDREYRTKLRQTEYWKQSDKSYIYFKKVWWDSLKRLKDLWEVRTKEEVNKLKKNILLRDGKDKEFNLLFKEDEKN